MKLGSLEVECPRCGENILVSVVADGPHRGDDGKPYVNVTADVTDVRHECSRKKART